MTDPGRQQRETPARKTMADRVGRDLGPRILSGVAMATIAIVTIWVGRLPLAVLLAAVGCVVAWEWGRIVRGAAFDAAMSAHVTTVAAAIALTGLGYAMPALVGVVSGTIIVGLLSFGRHSVLSAVGVPFGCLPGIALLWLRSDEPLGSTAVYFIIAVVAATDIAAYFAGRLVGGPKLWPSISPNKTWAGLAGGVTAAALTGCAFASFIPGTVSLHLALLSGILAIIAQGGDLAESALKRHFNAKDASSLIPGHGGFMDRVDGLATAAIAAAVLAASIDMATPARALLTW